MCILRPMVEFQPWSFVDKMSLSLMLIVISIGECVSFCDPVCFCFCFFFARVVFVSSSMIPRSLQLGCLALSQALMMRIQRDIA